MANEPLVFSNRFRTKCSACNTSLYTGQGHTVKEDGKFVNYCAEHYLRKYKPGEWDNYYDKLNTIVHGRPNLAIPKEEDTNG